MASIRKEIQIEANPEDVWAALRDFGAVHERIAPGFVVDSRLEDDTTRIVTFFNGAVAREVLVDLDDDARRLVYSVVESPLGLTHHNASAQVIADGDATLFVWTADLLPDDLAPAVDEMMDGGITAIKRTLEPQAVRS
jgi:carbon monoxide dehydrogenase subunit G